MSNDFPGRAEGMAILRQLTSEASPAFEGNLFVMEFPCHDPECGVLHRYSGNEVTLMIQFAEVMMTMVPGARGITITTMKEFIYDEALQMAEYAKGRGRSPMQNVELAMEIGDSGIPTFLLVPRRRH